MRDGLRALDPDRNGASLWETRVDSGGKLGGMHWGSATDGRSLYVAVGGQQLGAVADSTSREGYRLVPDPKRGGGLFALDLATGRKIWSAPPPDCGDRTPCSPAQSAPVTVADGVLFSGSLDGHLRAYSTGDGKIVWDVDTAREYDAVNGIAARGGSLDVAGPVVAGGMVFVTSGYALYGGMRGNVVLAFSIDGQ